MTDLKKLAGTFDDLGIDYNIETYKDTLEESYHLENIGDMTFAEFLDREVGDDRHLLEAKSIDLEIKNVSITFFFDVDGCFQEIIKY